MTTMTKAIRSDIGMVKVILTAVILFNPCVEESMQDNWWIFTDYSKHGKYNLTHCLDMKRQLEKHWLYVQATCN